MSARVRRGLLAGAVLVAAFWGGGRPAGAQAAAPGSGAGSPEDFSWALFLPAILAAGAPPPPACQDHDGDGYGNPASPACAHPGLDCDDADGSVHPGALEGGCGSLACRDGADNDCDGGADQRDSGCRCAPGGFLCADHTSTVIPLLPQGAIEDARARLHIGYGHTSHGSQVTDGMTGLVAFANGGGLGLSLPGDIFAWNNGGAGGALDLEEGDGYGSGWLDHDAGYYPDWVNETRQYLDDPSHADVNVIVWSWCGQVSGKYAAGTLESEYLAPMAQLEADYPGVAFVYMTGHVDHWNDADIKAGNQTIRDHCAAHGKVLYDFADIESYDPDGVFYAYPHDTCEYYASAGSGVPLGNWATAWQAAHTQGVHWYACGAAHTQPLNANRKAYAAWGLWARLAGWAGP